MVRFRINCNILVGECGNISILDVYLELFGFL